MFFFLVVLPISYISVYDQDVGIDKSVFFLLVIIKETKRSREPWIVWVSRFAQRLPSTLSQQ